MLIQWLCALIYFSSAKWKLLVSGMEWMNGYTLQYYFLADGLQNGRPLGVWFAQFHTAACWLSWITMFFEATFFLVLVFPWLAWVYLPLGVALHTGIYLTLGAPFFQFIVVYAVFVPWERVWYRMQRWRERWGRLRVEGAMN